jgi:hypothetical protein
MFVNARHLLTFSNQELDQLFKTHINIFHFRINHGASINQLKGFYQLGNDARIFGVFSDVVVFPIKYIRRREIGSLSFWLPLMFLKKQQISFLSYKLANWKMVFQNHGEHTVGLYIHHMNVGHFTLSAVKKRMCQHKRR